jgi:porin
MDLRSTIGLASVAACLCAGAAVAQDKADASGDSATHRVVSVTGNPAATTFTTGTGWLGRILGLRDEWGVTLGGMWLADTNLVVAGGAREGSWTNNSALFVGLGIDADKLVGWRGASFGAQFLQVNGADTNGDAGSYIGYNGIVGQPPHQRTELFELWYEQWLVEDVLKVRIGRSAPTLDFGNVTRPVALDDGVQDIPAVSSLLYTTIFLNGSLLHVLPGYYNPGNGVTVNFTPTKTFYVNLGVYDGNLTRGIQTGINPPLFTGYYVAVGEIGFTWLLGQGNHPGQIGIGLWRQTGLLTAGTASEDGSNGFYVFGSQRIARGVNASVPNSSISLFYQIGANSSVALPVTQSYGAGLTGFSLINGRPRDSVGIGVSWSRLNPNLFQRPSELMIQAYYQAHMVAAIFLQPTVTFIPEPGAGAHLPPTLTTTLRLTALF